MFKVKNKNTRTTPMTLNIFPTLLYPPISFGYNWQSNFIFWSLPGKAVAPLVVYLFIYLFIHLYVLIYLFFEHVMFTEMIFLYYYCWLKNFSLRSYFSGQDFPIFKMKKDNYFGSVLVPLSYMKTRIKRNCAF